MESFYEAARNGDIEYVKKYVDENKIIKKKLNRALIFSATYGHLKLVKYFVEEHQLDKYLTPNRTVVLSATNGHLHVVKYLISKGANIRIQDDAALWQSAQNGHLHIVKYLVEEHRVNIHAHNSHAIVWSAWTGHLAVVKYLISIGADVQAQDNRALILSAENGHFEVVKYLVSVGADVQAQNNLALILSAENGHLHLVKYLVALGADIRFQSAESMLWSKVSKHIDIFKYFLSIGIPIEKLGRYKSDITKESPEDLEFIVQFLPKTFNTSKKFNDYALKYGIVYQGSNYPPMEDEYKKRKEIRAKIKNEIYEKGQEILYRPGGIRAQLLEERFYENFTKHLI